MPPHQSPRLIQSSPLRRITRSMNAAGIPLGGNSPMLGIDTPRSPRTPRMGRQHPHTAAQGQNLIGHSSVVHSGLSSPSKATCSQILKSPQLMPNSQGTSHTARMGQALYVKPRGVPRTTTIDFKAFCGQPNSRRLSEGT